LLKYLLLSPPLLRSCICTVFLFYCVKINYTKILQALQWFSTDPEWSSRLQKDPLWLKIIIHGSRMTLHGSGRSLKAPDKTFTQPGCLSKAPE
jgi:hypothetical protein